MRFDITKPPPAPLNRDVHDYFGETKESKQRGRRYKEKLKEYGEKLNEQLRDRP